MTRGTLELDKIWAASYFPQIRTILRSFIGRIVSVKISSNEDDIHNATDYCLEISTDKTKVACRIRSVEYFYKYHEGGEFTLRKSRPSGVPTEYDKILLGSPRWYFYGWVDSSNVIIYWVFVDLDVFREKRLYEHPDSIKVNHDGSSGFVGYQIIKLHKAKAIKQKSKTVSEYLKDTQQMTLPRGHPRPRVPA